MPSHAGAHWAGSFDRVHVNKNADATKMVTLAHVCDLSVAKPGFVGHDGPFLNAHNLGQQLVEPMKTTIFSWGYYGWGNHTPELIEAVDAVEKSRGFKPPIFVDIRIRRSVRAAGFNGPSFEKLLGTKRHVWMKSLGNNFIETREGPPIQIADPKSAKDLLRFAKTHALEKRRLIYFCSCQWLRCEGKECHRAEVTRLLFKFAKEEGSSVELVEWPGGQSKRVPLKAAPEIFRAVRNGGKTIPLGKNADAKMLGLPWCSVATLHSNGESFHRIVGPAVRSKGQWCLPVLDGCPEPIAEIAEFDKQAEMLRRDLGLEPIEA